MDQAPGEVTVLLKQVQAGNATAKERLAEIVYNELHRIARRYITRERRGRTLQATGLLHEAFIELIEDKHRNWANRAHFIGTAAHIMRRILIDYARKHKRRPQGYAEPLAEAAEFFSEAQAADLLALDEALHRLKTLDVRKYQIVELRYLVEEAAEVLRVSSDLVKKEWVAAKVGFLSS